MAGFNTDAATWAVAGAATAVAKFVATGGYQDTGCLYREETFYGYTDYYAAPADYLGARSAYLGGSIHFRVKQGPPVAPFTAPLVVLDGANDTLIAFGADPQSDFDELSVSLSAGEWKHLSTGDVATRAELEAMLADLHGLFLRAEFANGADMSWFDEVVMSR